MTPRNFCEFAEKRQKELAKLLRSDLPRLMGTKAMQHFSGNFARITPKCARRQNDYDKKTDMTMKN